MNDPNIEERLNQLTGTGEPGPVTQEQEFSVMADSAVSQHIIRSHDGTRDIFAGEFRISIAPQQTVHVLHVPLYPPMHSQPAVEAFADNEAVRIRATDVQKFGVRLEIKVAASEETLVEIIQVQISSE
jgi:hypothetical protein